jgi:geranylgeranyl reductase family protein
VERFDVAVVGAGPAGTSAAITLARAGRSVVVLDRATFPRDKCCGDGLTTGALRELEALGLQPAEVPSWQPVDDVVVRSPSGREVTFPLPRGRGRYAVVARRIELDAALVRLTRSAGVEVREGHAVAQVAPTRDGVAVGDIEANYVIAADGMWSPVRKSLGLDERGYLGEWHAFRQYFEGVSEQAGRELVVWFEPDLLPGYAWSFPLPDGRANVGFGILRGGAVATRDMKDLWPDLLARPHVRRFLGAEARPESSHKAWPIPARIGRLPLDGAAGRVLFVGDAAAATDPMTGEGIGQALLTGRLAAEAIGAGRSPADVARHYRHAVRHDLAADDAMARALAVVLRSPFGARGALRVAGLSGWTRRNFARWLFEDYPRALLVTPRRWRGATGKPGAFRPSPVGNVGETRRP